MFTRLFLLSSLFLASPLAGCSFKQELPKSVDTPNAFGTIQDIKKEDNVKALLYMDGEDPYQKHWGMMSIYRLSVGGQTYLVHWEHADKFASLIVGDKINLHPTGYNLCLGGETEQKPTCYRLMKIYKSERRINPLIPGQ